MAKKFSDEPSFAALLEPAPAPAAAEQQRKEVKSLDDVQTALARATSAWKQLVGKPASVHVVVVGTVVMVGCSLVVLW